MYEEFYKKTPSRANSDDNVFFECCFFKYYGKIFFESQKSRKKLSLKIRVRNGPSMKMFKIHGISKKKCIEPPNIFFMVFGKTTFEKNLLFSVVFVKGIFFWISSYTFERQKKKTGKIFAFKKFFCRPT